MATQEQNHAAARRDMIAGQLRERGIIDANVLAAFQAVPRERFVPPCDLAKAYGDHPLPIGYGQTISQPYVVALMLQELDVQGHHRVLDVGAGSGYQTAILARLAGEVFAIERIAELAERARGVLEEIGACNVRIRVGDGTEGWADEAPFDRIVCGAGAPDVPRGWIEQLVDGGRIVAPVGGRDAQRLVAIEKRGGEVHRRTLCGVRFVRLVGREGWDE